MKGSYKSKIGCVSVIHVKFYFLFTISISCSDLLLWGFRHARPGSPYVFGLVGVDHDLEFPEPMPVVGMKNYHHH
jgi:hypothetical protein